MQHKLIVRTDYRDRPKDHEISAAMIMMEYFDTDITILRPSCQKSPDFKIKNMIWELKSPLGDGKNTIKNNLHGARRQSTNIILDLRRAKMHQTKAFSRVHEYFSSHRSQIRRLIVITKSGEVLVLIGKI